MNIKEFGDYLRQSKAPVAPLVGVLELGGIQGTNSGTDRFYDIRTPVDRINEALSILKDPSLLLPFSRKIARVLGGDVGDFVQRGIDSFSPDRIVETEYTIPADSNYPEEEVKASFPADVIANALDIIPYLSSRSHSSWPGNAQVLMPAVQRLYKDGGLPGGWDSKSLSSRLTSAVIATQIDDRMLGIWQGMMQGKPDPVLEGDIYDGFWGIVGIPGGGLKNPQPLVMEMAEGLELVKKRTLSMPDGETDYRYLLKTLAKRWPNHPDLISQLTGK